MNAKRFGALLSAMLVTSLSGASVSAGTILVHDLTYSLSATSQDSYFYRADPSDIYTYGPTINQTSGQTFHTLPNFSSTVKASGGLTIPYQSVYSYTQSTAISKATFVSNSQNIVGTISASDGLSFGEKPDVRNATANAQALANVDFTFEVIGSPVPFVYYRSSGAPETYTASPNTLSLTQDGSPVTFESLTTYYPGSYMSSAFTTDFPNLSISPFPWYYNNGVEEERVPFIAILQPGIEYHLTVDIDAVNRSFSNSSPHITSQTGIMQFAFAVPEVTSVWMMGLPMIGVGVLMVRRSAKRPVTQ